MDCKTVALGGAYSMSLHTSRTMNIVLNCDVEFSCTVCRERKGAKQVGIDDPFSDLCDGIETLAKVELTILPSSSDHATMKLQ